jgi:adenosylcobinamide-GDP ribazoletransferase
VKGLLAAVRFLTIVPVGGAHADRGPVALGHAAPWFPVVGLLIGGVLVGVEAALSLIFSPVLTGLLTVTAWKGVTGGLHLDGLADCLDGLVGRDPAHRLAIMADSRVGAFGVVGLVLFLGLEVGALVELAGRGRWPALLAAPTFARAMPPLLARVFRPARADGQGAAFRGGLERGRTLAAVVLAVVLTAAVAGPAGVLAIVVSGLVVMGFGAVLSRRLAGITGDVLGASVELTELIVLLTVAAWAHRRP